MINQFEIMNNLNWENLQSTGKNISEKGVYIVIMGMVLAVLPLLSFIVTG